MKKMFLILVIIFCGSFAFASYAFSENSHSFAASEKAFRIQSHGSTFVAYDDDDDDDSGDDDDGSDDGSDDSGWDD